MTLRKFAKLIGYSPSTVSKAFSGAKDIREETRNSIIDSAKELGLFEHFYKSSEKTKTVAIIVPEFNSGLYLKIISILSDNLRMQDAITIFSESGFSVKKADELISYYSSAKRADGIIVVSKCSPAKKYSAVPIVYLGKRDDPFADSVYSEWFNGICEVVFNFKLLKHKKIAFIGEKNTEEKEQLVRKAMKFYNLEINENYVIKSNLRHEAAGYESMKKLFAQNKPPTAILAAYDDIAIGAMRYAKELGLYAPKNFSIVGMDNSKIASNNNIMLSSVDSHDTEMCELIVNRIMKKIENPNYCLIQKTEIKSSLITRDSVGICPVGL